MKDKNKDDIISSVNGIKFTPREIDIISCIISGRNVKSISKLFNISTRTTESHIQSIKQKFGCNSKDLIARIAEKSTEHDILIEHYQNIYRHELLDEVSQKIKVFNKAQEIFVTHNLSETGISQKCIYLLEQCEINVNREYRKNENYINVNSTKLVLNKNDNEISLFSKVIRSSCNDNDILILLDKLENKNVIDNDNTKNKQSRLKQIIILFFVIIITSAFGIKFYFDKKDGIMSNLYYISNAMIVRTSLLKRIDQSIKNNKNDIKVIAITGRGGAGKTTIARNFIDDRSANIKWEINAESKQTIINSFEDLMAIIADKQGKQKELSSIRSISNPEERAKRIMSFVQSYLKQDGNWYLLFDNIDEMDIVKEYFPVNSDIWGRGVVLITTRNKNIGNSKLFSSNVVPVGHLSAEEQYQLFCCILYGESKNIFSEKSAKIRNFLSKIPMFPLDVSSAAYYIKNTNIEFDNYLSHVHSFSEDFENIHKKVISEYMEYNETRNGIIASMFNRVIKENHEFKGLLLLVCLIDSQNISIKFLEKYAEKTLAQEFIHLLKRFSMIAGKDSTFSIHRSTQEIGLKYILSLMSENEKIQLLDKIVKIMTPYEDILWMFSPTGQHKIENFSELSILIEHLNKLLANINSIEIPKKEQYIARILMTYLCYYRRDNQINSMRILSDEIIDKRFYYNGYLNEEAYIILLLLNTHANLAKGNFSSVYPRLVEALNIYNKSTNKRKELEALCFLRLARFYMFAKKDLRKSSYYRDLVKNSIKSLSHLWPLQIKIMLAWNHFYCFEDYYAVKKEIEESALLHEEVLKDLGAQDLFYKAPHLYKHITFADIGGFRRNLAQIYAILQQYEKALDNIKEAIFIYKKSIERSSILPESELKIEEGNILLRMNRLKEADVILTEAVDVRDRLGNPDCTLRAFIAISEISIRLGNLEKALIYCNRSISGVCNRDENSPMLLDSNCYYNMAIVLYKQKKHAESARYFSKVFELL